MSVTITSKSACGCCRSFTNAVGTNSAIGFTTVPYTFPTQTMGTDSWSASFSAITGAGISASGTTTINYSTIFGQEITATIQGALVDQGGSYCGFQLEGFLVIVPSNTTGSSTDNWATPNVTFPFGTAISEAVLTTLSDVNGYPVDMPLLSTWAFGDTPAPAFYFQLAMLPTCMHCGESLYALPAATATLSNYVIEGNENLTWAVANADAPGFVGCYTGDVVLGGNGTFNFQAARTLVALGNSGPGQTWQVSVNAYSQPYGSSTPFTYAGQIVSTYVTPSANYEAPFHIGWPLGFNFNVKIDIGSFVIVRTA